MKTIGIDDNTHEELKKYCKTQDISQGEFIRLALAYYKKNGIEPTTPPESIKDELIQMNKRLNQVIAFQKTFGSKTLTPAVSDIIELTTRLKNYIPEKPSQYEDIKAGINELLRRIGKMNSIQLKGEIPKDLAVNEVLKILAEEIKRIQNNGGKV